MTQLFTSLLLITFLCTCVRAQPLTEAQRTAIDAILMADIPDGGPGAALGIIRKGEVVYEQYAGLADVKEERRIDENTRFNIASSAKQFTALCVLKLIEAGQLKLEDDFRKYLPQYLPEIDEPITIAQLLNHTSGLRDVYELWGLQGITWWKETLDNKQALALLRKQQDLDFIPGSRHSYSNSNYILLTELIATVSGQCFRDYSDALFRELGMAQTNFADNHQDLGDNLARPYFNFDTWTTYKWRSDLVGDGALFTTLRDQLQWETMLMAGEAGKLSPEAMRRSQQAINDTTGYGYGLETDDYGGLTARWHDGSTGAWKASLIRFPEQHLAIVAMNNSGKFGTNQLVRDVAAVILGDELQLESFLTRPVTVGKAIPAEKLTGVYATEGKYYAEIEEREDKLFLLRYGRNDVELELEAGNVYRQLYDTAFRQQFTIDESGATSMTLYYWQHAPYSFDRLDIEWSGYDFPALNGNYLSDELEMKVEIEQQEGQNYQVKMNGKKRNAILREPDLLTVNGGYTAHVQRDENGKITGILVDGDRVQGVRYERE